jgi:hypothetical protein
MSTLCLKQLIYFNVPHPKSLRTIPQYYVSSFPCGFFRFQSGGLVKFIRTIPHPGIVTFWWQRWDLKTGELKNFESRKEN